MAWDVEFHDDFEGEFDDLAEAVQDAILAEVNLLAKIGPNLKLYKKLIAKADERFDQHLAAQKRRT